jgi:hypothetical protein
VSTNVRPVTYPACRSRSPAFPGQFRWTRVKLEANALEVRTLEAHAAEARALEEGKCAQGHGACGASIEAQARHRNCGFEGRPIRVRSRQDGTADAKRAQRGASRSPAVAHAWAQRGDYRWSTYGPVISGHRIGTHAPSRAAGRPMSLQRDWLPSSRQTLTAIIMASKKTHPSLSARVSFFSSSQINSGGSRH